MSATLYSANWTPRGVLISELVQYLKLDVKIVEKKPVDEEFVKNFPLGKIPAFIGKNGFKLTETIAIAYYLISLTGDERLESTLIGANAEEKASVLKWTSFSNSDMVDVLIATFSPLTGKTPYNKKNFDASMERIEKHAQLYELRLKEYTYLATENITLGDLIAFSVWSAIFGCACGADFRKKHPQLVRWFNTVAAHPVGQGVGKIFKPVEKALEPPQGKKKEQKQQQKKEQPKKAKAVQEPAPAAEKKPKHPLELLGRPALSLDDWKRKYMNEDTRPVALPWFWEHYDPEEWSLWKVEYKYNDELTLTFMSNNLVGGFFARLSESVKYMFGCLVVYGENNNNGIIGAVMIRGQDYLKAVNVAPDWESYQFTKLDPSKSEDKAFVEDMWAWDKPVIVDGEPREISDGKVLK